MGVYETAKTQGFPQRRKSFLAISAKSLRFCGSNSLHNVPDFRTRSPDRELMDDLTLATDALRQNLRELEVTNRLLGGNGVTLGGLETLLVARCSLFDQHRTTNNEQRTTTLADLGCGGGDMLRLMARFFREKGVSATLMGIDANAFMLDYARERTRGFPEISYRQLDVFSEEFSKTTFEVVTMTLFCHHFTDDQLVQLFATLRRQTRVGLIINDLHRHPVAYYAIWALATLLRTSHLYRHDARLSVARAFRRPELESLLRRAGFTRFRIRWRWAFRWEVVAWCEGTE
jgi:2-polyprenyl-3-methyl-5-hydroxy-6-metoxy-1,4-benzoquinol methylase